ncbi:hypothetical protein Sjap_018090 [Stephania japonica]|uniref:Uncharacterized protein n=1 Tax=Stephania japonica TaxID=461633 RepID=A0AAP0I7D7_9MAGN
MESNSSSSNKRKRTGEKVEAKAKELKVGINSGNNNDNGNGGIPVLLSDPALLDCNICLKPFSPPVFQCKFVSLSEQLSQHFKDNHSSERMEFSFGKPFSVRMKLYEPFVALQSSDGPVFLLNNFSIITSNSFTVVSLGNNNPKLRNLYRLTLKNGDDILTFSSRAKVTNRKNESTTLNCCSLTVAAGFTHSVLGQFELEITIYPE